jgi:hypothetical protein
MVDAYMQIGGEQIDGDFGLSEKTPLDVVDIGKLAAEMGLSVDYVKYSDGSYKINISSSPGESVESVVQVDLVNQNITSVDSNNISLLDRLKNGNEHIGSVISEQTKAIENQNKLLKENNETNAILVNEIKKQNESISVMAQALVSSSALQKQHNELINNQNQVNEILAGYIIPNEILKNQKLNFDINGVDDLENSNGDKIIPMYEKAKANSEISIEKGLSNQIDHEDLLSFFEDGVKAVDTMNKLEDDIFSIVLGSLNIDITKFDKE